MILYGTNPIAWANDDDQSIGADIPTDRILDEAGRQIEPFQSCRVGHAPTGEIEYETGKIAFEDFWRGGVR